MAGLGLEDFLSHNQGSSGRRKFFEWKKKGSAVIWLSTRAKPAYVSWNHPFIMRDTVEDKDTGREREILRYPRFTSPDPEVIHENQYFRNDDDRLRFPPRLDPFLLLREWLRHECDEPVDAVVFEWINPKDGTLIQWTRGHLARLVDRGRTNWNHSLDTKLEYLFVIVDDENPGEGPQITRETKLIGDRMKDAIRKEMDSNGDEGNPFANPYAFRWKFNKDAAPMDMYSAYRYNKAKLTPQIEEAITTEDFPKPDADTAPRPGDKAKIRAAMEDAARIDLPWDRLFVDEWEDDGETDFEFGENVKKDPTPAKKPAERTPEVRTKKKPEADEQQTKSSSPAPAGKPRRKKKEKKPPEPERIPCDDCTFMMLPTDSKCEQCGAEYEIDDEAEASGGSSSSESSSTTSEKDAPDKCWSCGSSDISGDRCDACGLDLTDDIPFG